MSTSITVEKKCTFITHSFKIILFFVQGHLQLTCVPFGFCMVDIYSFPKFYIQWKNNVHNYLNLLSFRTKRMNARFFILYTTRSCKFRYSSLEYFLHIGTFGATIVMLRSVNKIGFDFYLVHTVSTAKTENNLKIF